MTGPPPWELPACLVLDTALLWGEGTEPAQLRQKEGLLASGEHFSSASPPPCEFLRELNVAQEMVLLNCRKCHFYHSKLTGSNMTLSTAGKLTWGPVLRRVEWRQG